MTDPMANEATRPQVAGDKCEDCHGTGEVDLIDGHEQPCAACMSREFAVKYAAQSAEIERLRAQLAALQWTSVEERLPDYGVPVLIVYHGVVQNTLYVRDVGEWRSASDDESDHMPESFASHWMPKPAPPDPSGVQGKGDAKC